MSLRIISAHGTGIKALGDASNYLAMFGISPDYPFFQKTSLEDYLDRYFEGKHLAEYLDWTTQRFKETIVYLAPSLLSYNLASFEGKNDLESTTICNSVGEILEAKCLEVISDFKGVRFNRIPNNSNEELEKIIGHTREFSKLNADFMKDCWDLTMSACRNRLRMVKRIFGQERYEVAKQTTVRYSIDDIAVELYLHKTMNVVSVSKYEIPKPLKHLLYGEYQLLEEMIGVDHDRIGHIQVSLPQERIYDSWYDNNYEKVG